MTRGRDANTAHVATVAVPDDPAQGSSADALHRDPVAVLAGVLETADDRATVRAGDRHRVRARRTRPCAPRPSCSPTPPSSPPPNAPPAGSTSSSTTGCSPPSSAPGSPPRTARPRWRGCCAASSSPATTRSRCCATRSPGATSTTRDSSPTCSTPASPSGRRLDPVGDSYAEWIPRVDDPQWQRYLAALAAAADDRRERARRGAAPTSRRSGRSRRSAPPPDGAAGARGVGAPGRPVAAYRELRGHDDDATALGAPPKAGQVEAYAAYRAAWRALGRPEVDRDELEMSDGQLRMRVRAYEREKAWAPRYVGTSSPAPARPPPTTARPPPCARPRPRHADRRRAGPARTRGRRGRGPRRGARRARRAAARSNDARAVAAHTAGTRAAADRAEAVLPRATRDEAPEPEVTAEEWLALHDEAMRAEDPHREITDLVGRARRRDAAGREPVEDIREVAAAEPRRSTRTSCGCRRPTRWPTRSRRAQRALAEIRARDVADAEREVDEPARPARPLARGRPGRRRARRRRRARGRAVVSASAGVALGDRQRAAAPSDATPTAASPRCPRTSRAGAAASAEPAGGRAAARRPGTPPRSAPRRRGRCGRWRGSRRPAAARSWSHHRGGEPLARRGDAAGVPVGDRRAGPARR